MTNISCTSIHPQHRPQRLTEPTNSSSQNRQMQEQHHHPQHPHPQRLPPIQTPNSNTTPRTTCVAERCRPTAVHATAHPALRRCTSCPMHEPTGPTDHAHSARLTAQSPSDEYDPWSDDPASARQCELTSARPLPHPGPVRLRHPLHRHLHLYLHLCLRHLHDPTPLGRAHV